MAMGLLDVYPSYFREITKSANIKKIWGMSTENWRESGEQVEFDVL